MSAVDWIRLIRACYSLARNDRRWLADLERGVAPLASGAAPLAYTFSVEGEGFVIQVASTRLTASDPRFALAWAASGTPLGRRWHVPVATVETVRQRIRHLPRSTRRGLPALLHREPLLEAIQIVAVEPGGWGVSLLIPRQRRRVSPSVVDELRCVAAHLSTGLRLRRIAAAEPRAGCRSLIATVCEVERARERLPRAGPEEGRDLWAELMEGRSVLIAREHLDRWTVVLTRRVEPDLRDPAVLTPQERAVLAYTAVGYSDREIGGALGVAASTVASHLTAALPKLQLRSRRDAIRELAPWVGAPQGGRRGGDVPPSPS